MRDALGNPIVRPRYHGSYSLSDSEPKDQRRSPTDNLCGFSKEVVEHNFLWAHHSTAGETRKVWTGTPMEHDVDLINSEIAPFRMHITPTGKSNHGVNQYLLVVL